MLHRSKRAAPLANALLLQEPGTTTRCIRGLTNRLLLPAQDALAVLFFELRAETDAALRISGSGLYGRPYPYGYCREITFDSFARLKRRVRQPSTPGCRAMRAFLDAGGEGRCVWGVLRGKYFQTALQFGALYVDVANDTVVPTKSKIEILLMAEAGLEAVRDAWHFVEIAESYWGMKLYANHALPSLAPVVPMIGVQPDGTVSLQSATNYMMGLFQRGGFRHAEEWLATAPAAPAELIATLRAHAPPELLAANPAVGAEAALAACRSARERGLATGQAWLSARLAECVELHNSGRIAAPPKPATHPPASEKQSVTTLNLDGRTFEIDQLSDAAKAQITSIQFVDSEVARLQAQLAAMQTARNAYVEALRKELPAG